MPRLLLVEDEQVNRDLFRRRLERKGYTVLTAEDGASALSLTSNEAPDLVLMDLGLPDVDGWEVTKRLKTDPVTAAIPIIVLSAHATSDAKERAFAAGCQDFETKPVNWDGLFRKIEEWLAKAQDGTTRAAAEATAQTLEQASSTGVMSALQAIRALPPDTSPAETLLFNPKTAGVTPLPTGKHPVLKPPKDETKDTCEVRPKCILVVEDNDANRVMLCRRLNKHGYATVEAANGREALDAVHAHTFDLVLCDIMMPEVDGYEVLRELKADPDLKALPVIMISALDDMTGVVRCIEMGAEDYLQKPYDPVMLHARINACLDKRRLRDQELAYLRAVTTLTRAAELVEQGQFDSELLAPVAGRDDALGTLARVFDRMAREVQARMKQLQSDMQQMTKVEIDRREVVHEVSRVTASDAFEKARKYAEETRARRHSAPNPMTETMLLPKKPKI